MNENNLNNEIIRGWKNISKFMGWSLDALSDWRKDGFPVRKSIQTKTGNVFIFKSEAKQWMIDRLKKKSH